VIAASHPATFRPLVRPCSAVRAADAPPLAQASSADDRRRVASRRAGFGGGGCEVDRASISGSGGGDLPGGGEPRGGEEATGIGGGPDVDFWTFAFSVPGSKARPEAVLAKTSGDGSGESLTGGALGRPLGRGGPLGDGRGATLTATGEELGCGPLGAGGPLTAGLLGAPLTEDPLDGALAAGLLPGAPLTAVPLEGAGAGGPVTAGLLLGGFEDVPFAPSPRDPVTARAIAPRAAVFVAIFIATVLAEGLVTAGIAAVVFPTSGLLGALARTTFGPLPRAAGAGMLDASGLFFGALAGGDDPTAGSGGVIALRTISLESTVIASSSSLPLPLPFPEPGADPGGADAVGPIGAAEATGAARVPAGATAGIFSVLNSPSGRIPAATGV
jgi:hypothetical protein